MSKKLEKDKTWIKEHKEQVIHKGLMAKAATAAVTTVTISVKSRADLDEIPVPDSLKKYGVNEDSFSVHDGCVEIQTACAGPDGNGYSITVDDLDEFVAALMDIPGVNEESKAFISINVKRK